MVPSGAADGHAVRGETGEVIRSQTGRICRAPAVLAGDPWHVALRGTARNLAGTSYLGRDLPPRREPRPPMPLCAHGAAACRGPGLTKGAACRCSRHRSPYLCTRDPVCRWAPLDPRQIEGPASPPPLVASSESRPRSSGAGGPVGVGGLLWRVCSGAGDKLRDPVPMWQSPARRPHRSSQGVEWPSGRCLGVHHLGGLDGQCLWMLPGAGPQ
jgi:hypothetical protein